MIEPETRTIEDKHYASYYARKPVTIVRGKGALLYDDRGNEYVDCTGAYGACIVGHAHPRVVKAIEDQAQNLIACHGSVYNDARARFASRLTNILPTGLDRIFLSNSGTEAVECAIKVARKFTGRRKIVAVKGGFHGKTHGALAATWDSKYRKNFEPLVPGFVHIPFDNIEAAKDTITNDTAAVLVEPIQGEGGIRVPSKSWTELLQDLAHDAGGLLVADEIQTGFGRTGKMFASEHLGMQPDILCLGKGVASGLPIGITAGAPETMGSLSVGEHTSTFGGNPVVCAAGSATIDVLFDERLVDNAAKVGEYFKAAFTKLMDSHRIIREVRGLGLMLAVETRFDVRQMILDALQQRVLLLDAGRNVLRFLPPLCIQSEQVDRVVSILPKILEREELARLSS
ncbi:MAG TPA: aminotransferase class III-fold pyridoxal phosphate-dependent enzyme [Candidatus Acidoferrales bacterium]|nr:aminotransferase class III-fold pyridoxal phosphate-dependent enzyme [Candidatus Acidoferrales bacterium]